MYHISWWSRRSFIFFLFLFFFLFFFLRRRRHSDIQRVSDQNFFSFFFSFDVSPIKLVTIKWKDHHVAPSPSLVFKLSGIGWPTTTKLGVGPVNLSTYLLHLRTAFLREREREEGREGGTWTKINGTEIDGRLSNTAIGVVMEVAIL